MKILESYLRIASEYKWEACDLELYANSYGVEYILWYGNIILYLLEYELDEERSYYRIVATFALARAV